MQRLTAAERQKAAELGLSEERAAVALGLGLSLEQYAGRLPTPENPVDQMTEQAHIFGELARLDPVGREKLQTMAGQAQQMAEQMRADLAKGANG